VPFIEGDIMVIGVDRAQLQGLLDAAQLLQMARVELPIYAYLFARFRPEAHERIRACYHDRLECHFEGMTGVDDAEATRLANTVEIHSVGVRVRLTQEALYQILGSGYPVQQARGMISLGGRGNVPIKIHPGLGAIISFGSMTDFALVQRSESLEAYLFRLQFGLGGIIGGKGTA
jgi:hypothetical protein